MNCEVANPEGLVKYLEELKSINVDGVMVDCWWGIVEAHSPGKYNWDGYKELFRIVSEMKLKLQVLFSYTVTCYPLLGRKRVEGIIGNFKCTVSRYWTFMPQHQ